MSAGRSGTTTNAEKLVTPVNADLVVGRVEAERLRIPTGAVPLQHAQVAAVAGVLLPALNPTSARYVRHGVRVTGRRRNLIGTGHIAGDRGERRKIAQADRADLRDSLTESKLSEIRFWLRHPDFEKQDW